MGAYLVSLSNASKRVVQDVTCHIQAPPAKLRNGGVSASQGLQYTAADSDNGIQLSIPYLKQGDELQVTVIAEAVGYVPKTPDIAIRSPLDVSVTETRQVTRPQSFQRGFLLAAMLAAVVSGGVAAILSVGGDVPSQRDVLTFAASTAGLPRLAELYTTSADVYYYNQGDLAYAWAAASTDPAEIEKYRRLLSVTLDTAPAMVSSSRAALYYSRGKIDLLLADKDGAIRDFRDAIARSKSTISRRILVDSWIGEFNRSKNSILTAIWP